MAPLFSLDQILENVSIKLGKDPTEVRSLNLLRKGQSDSISKIEQSDRVYDTWQLLRKVTKSHESSPMPHGP